MRATVVVDPVDHLARSPLYALPVFRWHEVQVTYVFATHEIRPASHAYFVLDELVHGHLGTERIPYEKKTKDGESEEAGQLSAWACLTIYVQCLQQSHESFLAVSITSNLTAVEPQHNLVQ